MPVWQDRYQFLHYSPAKELVSVSEYWLGINYSIGISKGLVLSIGFCVRSGMGINIGKDIFTHIGFDINHQQCVGVSISIGIRINCILVSVSEPI